MLILIIRDYLDSYSVFNRFANNISTNLFYMLQCFLLLIMAVCCVYYVRVFDSRFLLLSSEMSNHIGCIIPEHSESSDVIATRICIYVRRRCSHMVLVCDVENRSM